MDLLIDEAFLVFLTTKTRLTMPYRVCISPVVKLEGGGLIDLVI